MKKRVISFVLGLTMVVSGFSFSFAEEDSLESKQNQEMSITSTEAESYSGSDDSKTAEEQTKQETDNTSEEKDSEKKDSEEKQEDNASSDETETTGEESPDVNLSFTDVQDHTAYYYNPVYWAVKNGITQGTSDTEFSPDASCTRAQIVTFLWRKAGKPDPAAVSNPFKDISESDYFYNAVLWAVETGITSGTSSDTFDPDAQCTRAQCATFLWRSNASPASHISGTFNDVESGDYYNEAVYWALEKGVTSGTSASEFSPDASCTRAQTVTFFYRASLQNVDRQSAGENVSGTLESSEINGKAGTFKLQAKNISAESAVQGIRVAVWTKNDKSDLHWYDLQDAGELNLNVHDFNRTFGVYHAKLYIVTPAGLQVELESKDTEIRADGYLYTEALGNREIRVTVLGIPEGNTVTFASWSDENYLDDLFWTDAEEQGNGTWSAVLETANFASAGGCNTDVYLNRTEVYNTTTYSVELWETMSPIEWEIYGYTQDVYNQVGTNLHSLFMWCVGLKYYRATPDPASGYTNSEWYALYGFKNHRGHCYVYAATFYWLAKNLGYDIHYVQGYVPRKGGGVITHGWTELIQNGTLYVVDPNFTNETGRNGYKITYGTSGTWRYQSYHRMS